MRFVERIRSRWVTGGMIGAALIAVAIPVIGQDSPESLLPPGFGDAVEDPRPVAKPPKPPKQGDGGASGVRLDDPDPGILRPDASVSSGAGLPETSNDLAAVNGAAATEDEDAGLEPAVLQDLPVRSRRTTAQVGVLGPGDGDMGATAYGAAVGPYLSHLMRKTEAPIASRWASITVRRALLSRTDTPRAINGADFAADRAWLLLRMGEADAARMLIQAVDPDQYSAWGRTVALQASLATADPAGICPAQDGNPLVSKEGTWMLARAMCSAFSGETSLAGALVDQARDQGKAKGIDVLLAEKVVGAASNARRSVTVQWEDVQQLTAWRYGLATATAVKIPDPLMGSVGPHVRAWRARAALLPAIDRIGDAEIAAALGVFSSAALVDHYAQASDEAEKSGRAAPQPVDTIGAAFGSDTAEAKASSIAQLFASEDQDPYRVYAHLIAVARAAALLPVSPLGGDNVDALIAAMMTTGLDVQAARWAKQVDEGSLAWALLAVGSPQRFSSISASSVSGINAGSSGKRAQFLLVGLSGLGRLSPETAASLAEDLEVPMGTQTPWTRAIDRAAQQNEPATVAVLGAIGLQGDRWSDISPLSLYHVISAYRRVGMEAEARMIAAEAITRS